MSSDNDKKILMPSFQKLIFDYNKSPSILKPIDQTVTPSAGKGTKKCELDTMGSEFRFPSPASHVFFERGDRQIQSNDEDMTNSVVAEESFEPKNKDSSLMASKSWISYEGIVNESSDNNDLPETNKLYSVRPFECIHRKSYDNIKQTRVKCSEDNIVGENVDKLPIIITPRELNDGHDGFEDSPSMASKIIERNSSSHEASIFLENKSLDARLKKSSVPKVYFSKYENQVKVMRGDDAVDETSNDFDHHKNIIFETQKITWSEEKSQRKVMVERLEKPRERREHELEDDLKFQWDFKEKEHRKYIDSPNTKLGQKESRFSDSKIQIQRYTKENHMQKAYESEIARLKKEIEKKDEEIIMIKMQQLTVSAKDDVIHQLRKQIKEEQKKHKKEQKKHEEEQKKHKFYKDKFYHSQKLLFTVINDRHKQITNLQTQNDKSVKQIENMTRQCQNEKLKTRIELNKLQNKLYNRDISVYELKDRLNKAEDTIDFLETEIKQYRDQAKTLEADKKDRDWRLMAMSNENDSLRDDVNNLKSNLKSVKAQFFESEERMLCFRLDAEVSFESSNLMLSNTQTIKDEWEEGTESSNLMLSTPQTVNIEWEEWLNEVPSIVEQSPSEECENCEFLNEFNMMISNVDAKLQSELDDIGAILNNHSDKIKEMSPYSSSSDET